MTTTRRHALGAVATAGSVAALAACGDGGDGGDDSGTDEDAGDTGQVQVPVAEVPEGGGLVRDRVVVTQPQAGKYLAFDARCPHQGCSVSEVTTTAIICPCHGSEFDPSSGEVTKGPATQGLAERTATVEGEQVVVS